MNYIEPTEFLVSIDGSLYKNPLVILDNVMMIYVHDFNLNTKKEHFAIEFIFNERCKYKWRFNTREDRDFNYRNIMDVIK